MKMRLGSKEEQCECEKGFTKFDLKSKKSIKSKV